MSSFDVAVIGSGPGGYVAAIRCSQLGLKTALIEKYNTLGGTCLNVGCIPSKSLLDSSHHFEESVKSFPTHGIDIEGEIKVNLAQMMKRKSEVVEQTTKGIDYLMGKNKITVLQGVGRFIDATHIEVVGDKTQTIEAKHTIIATGSKPASLPFVSIDKERIITSTEALSLKEIPKHLVVIGGGVIGLELGQVYRRLGAEVSVVEYADRITPIMDSSLSKELMKVMKKQGVKFYLSHQVNSIKRTGNEITITAKNKKEEDIIVTGNTVIDSLLYSVDRVKSNFDDPEINFLKDKINRSTSNKAKAYFHLHFSVTKPLVDGNNVILESSGVSIEFERASTIYVKEYQLSAGFNKTNLAYKIVVLFDQTLKTKISL